MHKSSDQGFTLVEVLIGMVIFSVGALVSAVLIISSVKNAEISKDRSAVSALVQQRLEEIRNRPWSAVGSEASLASGGEVPSDASLNAMSFPTFTAGFGETSNTQLTGTANSSSKATFYFISWQIVDLTESGVEFKRIVIKGAAMQWRGDEIGWFPKGVFEHVAMIYREDTSS